MADIKNEALFIPSYFSQYLGIEQIANEPINPGNK
jgi:hypothetical protein